MYSLGPKVVIAKVKVDGTYNEVPEVELLDQLTFVNEILLFFPKEKHLYVWIGKSVGPGLKRLIPKVKKEFFDDHPQFRMLRSFTVDQGEEPWKLRHLLDVSEDDLKAAQSELNEEQSQIVSNINELRIERDEFAKKSKYNEAIQCSEKIKDKANQIDDKTLQKSLKKEQDEFISNMQELSKSTEELREQITQRIEELNLLLEKNDIVAAHKKADLIRSIHEKKLAEEPAPQVEQVLQREAKAFEDYSEQQKTVIESINEVAPSFHEAIKEENLTEARNTLERIKVMLKDCSDSEVIGKWKRYENKLLQKEQDAGLREEEDADQKKEEKQLLKQKSVLIEGLEQLASEINNALEQNKIGKAEKIVGEYLNALKDELLQEERASLVSKVDNWNQRLETLRNEREERYRKIDELKSKLAQAEEKGDWAVVLENAQKLENAASEYGETDLVGDCQQKVQDAKQKISELEKKESEIRIQIDQLGEEINQKLNDRDIGGLDGMIEQYRKLCQNPLLEEERSSLKEPITYWIGKKEEFNSALAKEREKKQEEEKAFRRREENINRLILEIQKSENQEDWESVKEKCREIISLAKEQGNSEIEREYQEKLELAEKLLQENEERLAELKKKVIESEEHHAWVDVKKYCKEMMNLSGQMKKSETIEVCEEKLKNAEKKIQEGRERLNKLKSKINVNEVNEDWEYMKSGSQEAISIAIALDLPNVADEYEQKRKWAEEKLLDKEQTIRKLNELKISISESEGQKDWYKVKQVCQDIVFLAKDLDRPETVQKYEKKFEFAQEKQRQQEERMQRLNELEPAITENEDRQIWSDVKEKCQEAISLAKALNQPETVQEYEDKFRHAEEKIGEMEERLQNLRVLRSQVTESEDRQDWQKVKSDGEEVVALAKSLNMQEVVAEYEETLRNAEQKQQGREEKLQQLSELKPLVSESEEKRDWKDVKSKCEKAISLAQNLDQPETVAEYEKKLKIAENKQTQIEEHLAELKRKVIKGEESEYWGSVKENCLEIVQLAQKLGREDTVEEYKQKIRSTEDMLRKLDHRFTKLENRVDENQAEKQWFVMAENCKQIIFLTKKYDRPDLVPIYEEKLKFAEEKYQENEQKRQEAQKRMEEKAREVETLMEVEEDVMPDIDEIPLPDFISNLSDTEDILAGLNSILQDNRVEVKNESKSKSVLKTKSGETIEIEKNTAIQTNVPTNSADASGDLPQETKVSLTSGFENTFDDVIEEAIVDDVIPYNFEVTELFLNGLEPDEMPEKTPTPEGLDVKWKVENVQPNEKVEITYNLRNRVSRTILVPLETQMKVIKTHKNLVPLELKGTYEAYMKFNNQFNEQLSNIMIEDIIPPLYAFNVDKPEEKDYIESEMGTGSLLKWRFAEVVSDFEIITDYKLLELIILEDLKQKIYKMDKTAYNDLKEKRVEDSLKLYREIVELIKKYLE